MMNVNAPQIAIVRADFVIVLNNSVFQHHARTSPVSRIQPSKIQLLIHVRDVCRTRSSEYDVRTKMETLLSSAFLPPLSIISLEKPAGRRFETRNQAGSFFRLNLMFLMLSDRAARFRAQRRTVRRRSP